MSTPTIANYQKQADEITALHNEVMGQASTMLEKAIEIGALLTTVKEELPHGQWLLWIEANLPFTDRTARNYIKVYANREHIKLETVSDLTEAYRLLAPPKSSPAPKSEEHEAVVKPVDPSKVMFRCDNCDHEVDENDLEENPLYECYDCGCFTRENSADGDSHRCGGCNKYGHKVGDYGCPECGEGELTEQEHEAVVQPVEAVEYVDPVEPSKPIVESQTSNNLHFLKLYWRKSRKADRVAFMEYAKLEAKP